jgi:2-C-methyl-D-erythritol 4-phosphate cytidylyltransferase
MRKTAALIMAAGGGERFEGRESKTLHPLLGRPVVAWSAERFAANRGVGSVTVVVAPGEEDRIRKILADEHLHSIERIVPGGSTRQESVRLGLEGLDPSFDTVLVHDAARPCVTQSLIDRTLAALETYDAVVPVVESVDTLVRERQGVVDAVLNRGDIAGVQTPQGFRAELLVRAHGHAHAVGFSSSDDGSLVLEVGTTVRTIPGDRTNIKITYIEDAMIAESILERQRR